TLHHALILSFPRLRGAQCSTPGRILFASGWARKNAHIVLDASTLRLVGPTNHSGSGSPPGQVWPPPRNVESTTEASAAQFVYSRRTMSAAGVDSIGLGPQRLRRAQFAVQAGTAGNRTGPTHDWPPVERRIE